MCKILQSKTSCHTNVNNGAIIQKGSETVANIGSIPRVKPWTLVFVTWYISSQIHHERLTWISQKHMDQIDHSVAMVRCTIHSIIVAVETYHNKTSTIDYHLSLAIIVDITLWIFLIFGSWKYCQKTRHPHKHGILRPGEHSDAVFSRAILDPIWCPMTKSG